MKFTVITIEASPEDLRANRTVTDALTDALLRIGDIIGVPRWSPANNQDEAEEDKDG